MCDQDGLTSLLSSRPKSVRQVLRINAATNCRCLPILGDRDGVQLRQVDFNAVVHPTQRGEGAVVAIVSKYGDVQVRSELDLSERR